MEKSARILLVEDHNLVRTGIRLLLQTLSWVEVVDEASDGEEALQLIELDHPDIVLMDITMPKLNGLEVAEAIRHYPDIKIIILSMHASEEYVWQALRSGVNGYLLKDASVAELELALKSVIDGQSYLSPAISNQIMREYLDQDNPKITHLATLTSRKLHILKLIAEGNNTKQIADKLGVTVKTIESHRGQIMKTLDIHDVTGLVRYAIRTGLTSV